MPTEQFQLQSRRIVFRLRLLTATGLLGVITTLAVVGATLWKVRGERASLANQQQQLSETSNQLRKFAAQSHGEFEATLDGAEAQSDVGTALVNLNRCVQSELRLQPDPAVLPSLNELAALVNRLGDISNRAGDWRDQYELVNGDIRQQKTLNKVRGLVTSLRNELNSATGDFQAGLRTEAADQLSELARLIEVLAGEEQMESMVALRNRQLEPAIAALGASIKRLTFSVDGPGAEKTAAELRDGILGIPSEKGPEDSVCGGLYSLRLDALRLRREREKLKNESALLFEQIDQTISSFAQSAQGRTVALAGLMERALANGWRQTLVFGGLCCAVLFWLGFAISRGVYGQVRQIEEARAEAERGRQITQKLMAEQQAAAVELEAVHKKLLETSRQAGMAEVATGVLHNVGNVLNSVNVSSSLIAENLKKSRLGHLARIVTLFREKAADLGTYITSDPAGRQIPGFLAQLSDFLANEQADCARELAQLQKNIGHIKDIVSMQQAYACSSGFRELVDIRSLIDDALNIHLAALTRHDITVVKEYGEVPKILADKHKILQIMVNFVSNAKHAMAESSNKTLTLRVECVDGQVKATVKDTGYGIAPENLTRIFAHGFTTKKGGHGFGLHSGAIAVKDAGGSMNVHSDGPGKGAMFTVSFPVSNATAMAA
jgi:signal transduction histidine kinase